MKLTALLLTLLAFAPMAQAQHHEHLADARDASAQRARRMRRAESPPRLVREREHGLRLRGGFSIGVAGARAHLADGSTLSAVGGTLQGRVGAQLNDVIGVYYQAAFGAGHGIEPCLHLWSGNAACGPAQSSFVADHASSVVADFTLGAGAQLGVGGSVLAVLLGGGDVHARFGPLFRVGYAFGGDGPGDRSGFAVAAQLQLGFPVGGEEGVLGELSLLLGWESF